MTDTAPNTMRKLRTCVFLEGEVVPRWIAEALKAIRDGTCAELVFVMTVGPARVPTRTMRGPARRLLDAYRGLLFDRPLRHAESTLPVDARGLLDGAERLHVADGMSLDDSFTGELRKRLRELAVDVVICLGVEPACAWLPGLAPAGTWAPCHGHADVAALRASREAPGFWEVLHRLPTTRAALCMLDPETGEELEVAATQSCTVPFSVPDNINMAHWDALSLVLHELARLHRLGAERFVERARARRPQAPPPRTGRGREPGSPGYARSLLGLTLRKAAQLLRNRIYIDQWILLYRFDPRLSLDFGEYLRLLPPRDRIWADPFALQESGKYYIFFEEMPLDSMVGHIAVMEIDAAGNTTPARTVLQRPYHLSYPFLFRHEGALYMIPESGQSHNIELYRCTTFPDRWEFVHSLMENVRAYDVTLLQRDGRWWLFAGMVDTEGASSWNDLFLFSSDSPLSRDWTPHPDNPIVSDCRAARPAGALFEIDGALHRPSQNCAPRYGYGLNLARVDALDSDAYDERIFSRILPGWDPDILATHTFNRCGDLQVIDAQIRRRRF